MKITENIIQVKDYLTKSNLPASDYVINPYIGCPHSCRYCYACFMKRFTRHDESWGSFIDIKLCDKPIDIKKLSGKSVFLSSVTDCYNPFEEKYRITRQILEQLVLAECELCVSTKSSLICRDIDLLKQMHNVKVALSVNTLNESFRRDMDNADSIEDRLNALQNLYRNGIYTVLFMSPIFPHITNYRAIIEATRDYVNEYWFENLNLRGNFKPVILNYISQEYPYFYETYKQIYLYNNNNYWDTLSVQINQFCEENNIKGKNYFHHNQLVKSKNNS